MADREVVITVPRWHVTSNSTMVAMMMTMMKMKMLKTKKDMMTMMKMR